MKVRMKTEILGTRNGVRWPKAGGEVDLPANEAVELLAGGLAEPVAEDRVEKRPAGKRAEKRG